MAYSSFDHVRRAEFSTAGAGAPRVQFCMSASPDKNDEPVDLQVPKAVVSRLSLYLRELEHLVRDGHSTISSSQLGSRLGFTDAQVRKDLAYFGHFGYPGIGYRCEELIAAIKRIMGT